MPAPSSNTPLPSHRLNHSHPVVRPTSIFRCRDRYRPKPKSKRRPWSGAEWIKIPQEVVSHPDNEALGDAGPADGFSATTRKGFTALPEIIRMLR